MSMPTTLRVIREEHRALKAILQSLHLLIQQGPGENETSFFRSLRAMLFYIDRYPERLHHPKETELLFPKVREKDTGVAEAVSELDHDHEASELAVRQLQLQLLGWEFLGESERLGFVTAFENYKRAYLAHMELEESAIFPSALQHLSTEDWVEIDAAFTSNRDPLTGHHPAEGVFAELFSRIVREAPQPIGLG
ncbi:MAG: hemerythrin domain-containing protein [Burkholderiales bacterium]|nr:hemerythrin domain-containing protein [Burkholderiales bacterium]